MIKFIKMKKKIIFAVATGFFAVATVFNMNLLQGNSAGDVSLDAIAVMAQATEEAEEASLITGWLYDVFGGRWENEASECVVYLGKKDFNNANASGYLSKKGGRLSVEYINGVSYYSITYNVYKCGAGRGNCWYSEDC